MPAAFHHKKARKSQLRAAGFKSAAGGSGVLPGRAAWHSRAVGRSRSAGGGGDERGSAMEKVAFANEERGGALRLRLPAGCQWNAFHLGRVG